MPYYTIKFGGLRPPIICQIVSFITIAHSSTRIVYRLAPEFISEWGWKSPWASGWCRCSGHRRAGVALSDRDSDGTGNPEGKWTSINLVRVSWWWGKATCPRCSVERDVSDQAHPVSSIQAASIWATTPLRILPCLTIWNFYARGYAFFSRNHCSNQVALG